MTERQPGCVLVLPPRAVVSGALREHEAWLLRGTATRSDAVCETLLQVLSHLELRPAAGGLAALRLWGQTGAPPSGWIGAAEPVHLRAMRDHLRLVALSPQDLQPDEDRILRELLHSHFEQDSSRSLLRVGDCWYVSGGAPFATAKQSAHRLDGRTPDEFLPTGEGAAIHDRLIGELQLLLHEHEVNRRREARGAPAVNSIWFWGGGEVAPSASRPLPRLIADDPLFLGYWRSRGRRGRTWPSDADAVLQEVQRDTVVVVPCAAGQELVSGLLTGLRRRLLRGGVPRLQLIFRDGWQLTLTRGQLLRFWRPVAPNGWPASPP